MLTRVYVERNGVDVGAQGDLPFAFSCDGRNRHQVRPRAEWSRCHATGGCRPARRPWPSLHAPRGDLRLPPPARSELRSAQRLPPRYKPSVCCLIASNSPRACASLPPNDGFHRAASGNLTRCHPPCNQIPARRTVFRPQTQPGQAPHPSASKKRLMATVVPRRNTGGLQARNRCRNSPAFCASSSAWTSGSR